MPDDLTLSRVSSASLAEATGQGWGEWLAVLDAAGAGEWDHRRTVSYLQEHHAEVPEWWRQTITVGYEQARGKRVVGQTAAAGFQVGVRRSVAASPEQVWAVLVANPDLWLGQASAIDFTEGAHYEVLPADRAVAVTGEIRVVKPGDRLRMTWHPADWERPATLQIALTPTATGKTTITAHMEKLPDADGREAMRGSWQAALDRVVAAVAAGAR